MQSSRFKLKKVIWFLLPAAWMILIFYFSSQSAEESAELSGGLLAKLTEIFNLPLTEHFLRKAAHFSEYMILGALVLNGIMRNFSKAYPQIAVLICALYSMSDEIHQHFIPGRSCQLSDMLLDTTGAALGVLLLWFFAVRLGRNSDGKQ